MNPLLLTHLLFYSRCSLCYFFYHCSVAGQLRETNAVHRSQSFNVVDSLQKRCLRALSPKVAKHDPPATRKVEKSDSATSVETKEESKPKSSKSLSKPSLSAPSIPPGRPPTRRIQRPTSIRRPKLIGKSQEGAAVQAMAASRARARGNSPFQKSTKAAPKDAIAVASKPAANTAVATRVPIPNEDTRGQSDQRQGAVLSALLSAYVANCFVASTHVGHTRSVQVLVDKFWVVKPERPLSLPVQNFLLSRSIHLWGEACNAFGFPDRVMRDLSGYFAQWLNMSKTELNLLQLNATSQSETVLSPSSTLIVELKNVKQRNLCVVLRTSLKYPASEKHEPKLRCDAWMLMLNRSRGDDTKPKAKRKQRRPINSLEREATLVDKKVYSFAVGCSGKCMFSIRCSPIGYSLSLLSLPTYSKRSALRFSSLTFLPL